MGGQDPPDWQEILKYFRGSELQNYFTKVLEDNLKALIKPQYVDQIPKALRPGAEKSVKYLIESRKSLDNLDQVLDVLGMTQLPW